MSLLKKLFFSLIYRMPIISSLIVTASLLILTYFFFEYEKILAVEHSRQEIAQQRVSFKSFTNIWKREIYTTIRNFVYSPSGEVLRKTKFNEKIWENNILEFTHTLNGVFGVERISLHTESGQLISDYGPYNNKAQNIFSKKFANETFENDEVLFKLLKDKEQEFFLFSLLIDQDNNNDSICIVLYLNPEKFRFKFSELYGHRSVLVGHKNKLLSMSNYSSAEHYYSLRKTVLDSRDFPEETWLVSFITTDSIIKLIGKEKFKLRFIMFCLIFFSLFFSFIITYRTFLPVKNIMKTIENMTKNNYKKEFEFVGKSELNYIGSELNRLMDSVSDAKIKEKEMDDLNEHLVVDLKQKIVGLNITAIISETDLKGAIIDCNDRFCEISKYTREELVGQDHRILNSGYHSKDFWINCWKKISSGKVWKEEVCNKDKEGQLYWVLTTIFPTKSFENEITGFTSIRIDITAQKELAQEKEKASKSEKLASLGELSAGIGHEINNPLAVNMGNIRLLKKELIKNEFDKDKTMERLEKMSDANERIRKIVDGLRTFARGDSGIDEVVSIRVAIDQTINLISEIYEREGVIISDLTPKSDLTTLGNLGKVQQIIMNLVSNARDATQGQENRLIDISLEKMGESFLVLGIKDNGVGISDDLKEKILQPFFTTKDVGKGTGMGLGIVTDFIKNMGGELIIESEPDEGSLFSVVLPLMVSEETIEEIEEKVSEITCNNSEENSTFSGMALVVDDEEGIREILMDYLDYMGIKCHEADDGDTAIEMVLKHKYDFIFTDMKMARMQGDEFIKKARKLPNGDTRYFIVTGGVSTNTTVEEREELYNLAEAYIDKPFSPDTILEVISKKQKEVA